MLYFFEFYDKLDDCDDLSSSSSFYKNVLSISLTLKVSDEIIHRKTLLWSLQFTCQNDPSVDQEMFKELGEVPRPKPFTGASMYSEN